jgi:hypothetical protein
MIEDVLMADVVKKLDEIVALLESRPNTLYYWSTPLKSLYTLKSERKTLAEFAERHPYEPGAMRVVSDQELKDSGYGD